MKTTLLTSLLAVLLSVQVTGQGLYEGAGATVSNAGKINTPDSDISPVYVEGQLYWTSVGDQYQGDRTREARNEAFYNTFFSPLGLRGEITGRRTPVRGFGEDYHEGPVCWSSGTGELFSTLSNVVRPDVRKGMIKKEAIRLRLVIQEKRDGRWEITRELPFNDRRYHFAHPAVNAGGDTLVFASDMPSGNHGQSDLYMSVLERGQWSVPVNLGEKINTKGNEMFPTFLPGGYLSFASDGRDGGKGGLDIWYVRFPDMGEVYHCGGDINTSYDDFGLSVSEGKRVGYFSSKRTGNDDIYRVDFVGNGQGVVFTGTVVDDQGGVPLAGAKAVLYGCQGEELSVVTADSRGVFQMEVPDNSCPVVIASHAGYSDVRKGIENLPSAEFRLRKGSGRSLALYELQTLDGATLEPVSGATVSCGGSGRWDTDSQGVLSVSPEQVAGCNLLIKKEGYLVQTFVADPSRLKGDRSRETVYLFKKELNRSYVLRNIYYDLDRWEILPESAAELDNLVRIMQDNPEIRVELGSHTDSRAGDAYNQELSQKRSESAVGYIVSRGIAASRITAVGYGESRLVNGCGNGVKCPEAMHRQNRRTEFKIIGM